MDDQKFIDELAILHNVESDSMAHANNELLIAHDVLKSTIKLLNIQYDKLKRLSNDVPAYSTDRGLMENFIIGLSQLQQVQKGIDTQLVEGNWLLKELKEHVAKNDY